MRTLHVHVHRDAGYLGGQRGPKLDLAEPSVKPGQRVKTDKGVGVLHRVEKRPFGVAYYVDLPDGEVYQTHTVEPA